MAYTNQQILEAMAAGNAAGMSNADVIRNLESQFGLSPIQVADAYAQGRPDLFSSTDAIMANVNSGNYAANTNDPLYQARTQMLDYTRQFEEPPPDLSQYQGAPTGGYGGMVGGGSPPPLLAQPQQPPANPMGLGQGTFSEMYGGYQASPWLSATADEIGRRTQDALGQSFNGIRSNAVGVGGLGGSRQGVAQGMATSNAIDSLQGNLANLFGQDWTQAQNRGLQARGQDQGFAIGLGSLANQRTGLEQNYELGLGQQALTGRGQDMSMFNTNRSLDLQQLGLGANIYDMGVKGGWAPLTTAGGLFNQTAGNNTTTTSGGTQGGGWGGAAGGLLAGGSLAQQAGWWNPWK